MDKRTTGLIHKFSVTRTDGTDAPGGKHDGCDYFVLDLTHDPHALPAIRAYAESCRADYPALAADLDAKAASPAPVEPPPAETLESRLEGMRGKMPDAEIDAYKAILSTGARRQTPEDAS